MPAKRNRSGKKLKAPDEFSLKPMNVECICPKCGVRHVMNFEWTGRGTPRKYCSRCKHWCN